MPYKTYLILFQVLHKQKGINLSAICIQFAERNRKAHIKSSVTVILGFYDSAI